MKLVIASTKGGHLTQIMEFIKLIDEPFDLITDSSSKFMDGCKNLRKIYLLNSISSRWDFINQCKNVISSFLYMKELHPKLIITNGSGVVLFFCIISKIFGSKIIFIESISRIYRPSLFGKLIQYFADRIYVQWPSLKKNYRNANYNGILFDLRHVHLKEYNPIKQKIFVSIGSRPESFGRLINSLDIIQANHKRISIFAQIGNTNPPPKQFSYTRFLPKKQFEKRLQNSDVFITTDGAGNIFTSLKYNIPTIIVMRDPKRKEILVPNNDLAEFFTLTKKIPVIKNLTDLDKTIKTLHPPNLIFSDWLVPHLLDLIQNERKK